MNNNTLNYTIQENNKTVKSVMMENLNFSRRLSKKLDMNNKLFLNGAVTSLNKSTFKGDILSVEFDEDENRYEPSDIPIDILYEDNDLLVVNKPPYIVVHPTMSHQDNTVANRVVYYFKQNGIKRKVRFVNRLDMNTSGIVIIAKNPYVHNNLSRQMKSGIVDKYYYAIVEGNLKTESGVINEPILRLNSQDIVRVVHPSGKECITHYTVEKRLENMTLLKLRLETGRSHQIRVHMKHIGHPVLGDTLYGSENCLIKRQALHCCEMKFIQPVTGKRIEITCPMPKDMRRVIEGRF